MNTPRLVDCFDGGNSLLNDDGVTVGPRARDCDSPEGRREILNRCGILDLITLHDSGLSHGFGQSRLDCRVDVRGPRRCHELRRYN